MSTMMRDLGPFSAVVWLLVCTTSWWGCWFPHVGEGCSEEERRALLQLRDDFYHPTSPNESEWSWVGGDCCSWKAVGCQDRPPYRVVSIYLPGKRKEELGSWSVNASLLSPLDELQDLDLSGNLIGGWLVPAGISSFKNLTSLNLQDNMLSDESVSWFFNHTSLAVVDLSYNKLKDSSTLKGFCQLKNLMSLTLDGNTIEGNIDPCVGNMPALQILSLNNNRLTGSIPSFSNLTSIETILMGGNQFTGIFSFSSLANLTNLTGVDLSNNYQLEVETEYPTWVPSFQLVGLVLNNCILNRRGGSKIPSFLSTQTNMNLLFLGYTSIQGSIPPWLIYNIEDRLFLRGNRLKGPFPQLQQNKTLQLSFLDLSDNNIYGQLPKNMSTLLPNLDFLNLSTNVFHGSIASSSELRFVRVLDLSYNNLYGEIPYELTGNNTSLDHLSLSSNNLVGNMLPRDSNMSRLSHLSLDVNRFTGAISPNLSNSPSLRTLDLRRNYMSGVIPSVLSALPQLAALLLSGNHFQGNVPTHLCRMQSLRILDLSDNSLSGTIPPCLNNVTSWKTRSSGYIDDSYWDVEGVSVGFVTKGAPYLYKGIPLSLVTGIDISMNQLSSGIPVELGDLRAIQALNLSHNYLSGPIPESFQSLENIESLDVSHNQLVGNIPPQIVQLHYLSVFSVAYNDLSGAVPIGNQFSTFNKSSFEGNPGLCGQLLEISCPSNGTKQVQEGEGSEAESNILDSLLLYSLFIVASCATGFWCFIGALALNKNLQVKYFEVVDEWTDAFVERIIEFKFYLRNCCNW